MQLIPLQPPSLFHRLKPQVWKMYLWRVRLGGVKSSRKRRFLSSTKRLDLFLVFLSCSCGCYSCSNITAEVAYTVGIYISMTMFDSFGLCTSYRYLCRIDGKYFWLNIMVDVEAHNKMAQFGLHKLAGFRFRGCASMCITYTYSYTIYIFIYTYTVYSYVYMLLNSLPQ